MENCSSRSCRCRTTLQPESFQRQHAKLVFHQRHSVIGREYPVVERRLREARAVTCLLQCDLWRLIKKRQGRGIEHLARAQLLQLFQNAPLGVLTAKLRGPKFSRG